MAYTSANLASVETAIFSLSSGSRVVSVSLGDKTIEYGKSNLSDLEALRATIIVELGNSRTNCILTKTSKGL